MIQHLTALALVALAASPVAQRVEPRLTYELRSTLTEDAGYWDVALEVKGLSGDAPIFELSEWGGWTQQEWRHFELLECTPPMRLREGTRNIVELVEPGEWKGKGRVVYRLHLVTLGSEEQQRCGLLPTRAPDYAYGYSWNTLLRVLRNDERVEGRVTIDLHHDGPGEIITGWEGACAKRQKVELDSLDGNGPIAFGHIAHETRAQRGGLPLEMRQFGAARDVTPRLVEILQAVMPHLIRHTDRPLSMPYRAFVTDTQGGGMGSHYGLRVGFMEDEGEGHEHSPWFAVHVTHELIHEWLGIRLHEGDSSLVWFKEGFTEYFALWQAAAVGLVSRDWFAQRLLDLESIARSRSALGQVAFADPDVTWRDGDGPVETLAYTGAPLLALVLDVELRAAGHPGLLQLLRDLLARADGTYSLADLREWLEQAGLADRYARSVAGLEMPRVSDVLVSLGYERTEEEVPLTYFGLRCEDVMFHWTVLAVDPEGPAAAAGIQVGDVINGYYPTRGVPPRVREPGPEYDFGLTRFEPGVEGTFVGVNRGDEELKIFIEPELVPGGYLSSLAAGGKALDDYFRFRSR